MRTTSAKMRLVPLGCDAAGARGSVYEVGTMLPDAQAPYFTRLKDGLHREQRRKRRLK